MACAPCDFVAGALAVLARGSDRSWAPGAWRMEPGHGRD
jgi:hypothetical protein